ncbi:MAG: hypothetical protein FJY98_03620 [Candidatus Liptonbacteria bacterium]|nr:hypothetical protein [Candidatus Liptonbacteria bacterium]
MNTETKQCQACKTEFSIEPEDFAFFERLKVPAPTFCPSCRLQRRLTWRNERSLFRRVCAKCNKSLISVFSSDKPFPVYCSDCYHGDSWDPLSYGREVDFSRPFLTQFRELQIMVPRQYALVFNNVNSEYVNGAGYNKNCYLTFVSDNDEDCAYLYNSHLSRNSVDLMHSRECEWSVELTNYQKVSRSAFCSDCKDSYNLFLSRDCSGCHDCVASVGLRNKSYCIFNKQYSKEEYEQRIKELKLDSHAGFEKLQWEFLGFCLTFPVKYYHGISNVRTTGDDISFSKNSSDCFSSRELEDCKFLIHGNKARDCEDVWVAVEKSELCYDSIGCFQGYHLVSTHLGWLDAHSSYIDACEGSSNLFGCVGLRQKEYCILNKQYSKESFETLRAKIIEHMNAMPYRDQQGKEYRYGDFFPAELSPYSYNQTVAQEVFPLTKESAVHQGFSWRDPEARQYTITLASSNIPDRITDVPESVTGEVIECAHAGKCEEQCSTAFKVIPLEMQLYRTLSLPLPRLCSNCRHYQRTKHRNPLKLWKRECVCAGGMSKNGVYKNSAVHFHEEGVCPNSFETSYSPERAEIVYCEQCYQAEVV